MEELYQRERERERERVVTDSVIASERGWVHIMKSICLRTEHRGTPQVRSPK